MFYARDNGLDLPAYHKLMYDAAHVSKINLEDIGAVSEHVKNFTDAEKFKNALAGGAYIDELNEANDYAYEKQGVWYIPAYRMNGKKLDSEGGAGITRKKLEGFLKSGGRP